MKREFNRIAVTDDMVEVLRRELNTNESGAENVMRQIIEAGGLGMVRAKGSHLSEAQIAAIEKGIPSDEESRSIRLSVLALFVRENSAHPMDCCANLKEIDRLAEYVLTGKKPGEG